MAETIPAPRSSDRLLKGALFAGGIIFLYTIFAKKSSAANLNFLPGPIKGLYWDGVTPYLVVGVIAQNTSNQAFTLKSLAGSVFSQQNGNNYTLGNFSFFQSQIIQANSQSVIWVNLRFGLIGIVSDIINSMSNGVAQVIQMKGTANVEGWQIPLDFKFNVSL